MIFIIIIIIIIECNLYLAPLIFSAKTWQPSCMEVLCEWGCNVNATDYKNNTGLHYLAKKQESNQPSAIYEYKLKRSAFGTRAEQKDYKKFARLYINAIEKVKQMEEETNKILLEDEEGDKWMKEEGKNPTDDTSKKYDDLSKETNTIGTSEVADWENKFDDKEYHIEDDMSEEQILKLLADQAKAEAEIFDPVDCLRILKKIHRDDLFVLFKEKDKNIESYINIATDSIYDLDSDRKVEVLFQFILNLCDLRYLQLKFLKPCERLRLSSRYTPAMELTSAELIKQNVLDQEDMSQLTEYSVVSTSLSALCICRRCAPYRNLKVV